jgi:murein DD-endopeptidase MepM/ murein hydrolase activator NlpD
MNTMYRTASLFLLTAAAGSLLFSQERSAGPEHSGVVSVDIVTRDGAMQGEPVIIDVTTGAGFRVSRGTAFDRDILFWPESDGRYRGILGLDRDAEPGPHPLSLDVETPGGGREQYSVELDVNPREFRLVSIRVRAKPGGLSKEDVDRIMRERATVDSLLSIERPVRLWRESFGPPLDLLTVTEDFGSARIINGRQRSPHSGVDLRGSRGTPIRASNAGVVALTAEHFYAGRSIYIDHGLGVYSMYFHCDRVLVKEGDVVQRGQIIGTVGSTGRSTGPHLHWGVRIAGAGIDPISLMYLPMEAGR